MTLPDSSDFDNLLVRQKDSILRLINNGRVKEATAIMDVVTPMWEAASYGYKVREVLERIKNAQA